MRIDYSVTEVVWDHVTKNVVSSSIASTGTTTVAHNLSDLTSLQPGVGYRTNDANVPWSGQNFEWFPEADDLVQLPEPSGALLAFIGAGVLGLSRRRRK